MPLPGDIHLVTVTGTILHFDDTESANGIAWFAANS